MFGPRSRRGSWVRPSVVCGSRLLSALPARTSRTGASSEAPRCDDGRPLPRVSTVGGRPPPGREACCAIHSQALQPGFGQCDRWRAERERSIQAPNTSSRHRWGLYSPNALSRNGANAGAPSILCGRLLLCELRSAALHQTIVMQEPRDERESLIGVACVPRISKMNKRTKLGTKLRTPKEHGTKYTTYNLNQEAGDRETCA